jgi:cysteinyl-tRNA synthetase
MMLTILYDTLKDDNLNNHTKLYLISEYDKVLSLNLISKKDIDESLLVHIKEEIEKRNQAKQNKDYALADAIRDNLLKEGILLKDTREGTDFELIK